MKEESEIKERLFHLIEIINKNDNYITSDYYKGKCDELHWMLR